MKKHLVTLFACSFLMQSIQAQSFVSSCTDWWIDLVGSYIEVSSDDGVQEIKNDHGEDLAVALELDSLNVENLVDLLFLGDAQTQTQVGVILLERARLDNESMGVIIDALNDIPAIADRDIKGRWLRNSSGRAKGAELLRGLVQMDNVPFEDKVRAAKVLIVRYKSSDRIENERVILNLIRTVDAPLDPQIEIASFLMYWGLQRSVDSVTSILLDRAEAENMPVEYKLAALVNVIKFASDAELIEEAKTLLLGILVTLDYESYTENIDTFLLSSTHDFIVKHYSSILQRDAR